MNCLRISLLATAALTLSLWGAELPKLDLGSVREEHIMIPMRDGKRLSAYAYFPPGDAKLPAIFEQRYADITSAGSRVSRARPTT